MLVDVVDKDQSNKKLGIICSSGGHLAHLRMLVDVFDKYEQFWVAFDKKDFRSLQVDAPKYNAFFPTNRNIKNLFKNLKLAYQILKKERPNLLISTGAGIAVPFFYLAKWMKIKLVYLEVYDKYNKLTLTGRLVYPICNYFIVQHEHQTKTYKKAIYIGSLF